MTKLFELLCESIQNKSKNKDVAVLLSAGADSLSVALACREVGKRVHAYTYELDGIQSRERAKVEATSRHLGLPLTVVRVPTHELDATYKRLAIEDRCKTKVQFEVLYPMRYVLPEIEEGEVWTGWNADDHYGNTRKYILAQASLKRDGASDEDRAKHFRDHRAAIYRESDREDPEDTFRLVSKIAERHGKRFLDPYLDHRIREFFLPFSHERLSHAAKPFVREALASRLNGLPASWIARRERLQKGGRVDELFLSLLPNADINRFETKYNAVAPLCQRWGIEVEANGARFLAELEDLPSQSRASCRASRAGEYRPYNMSAVREASAARKFNVISTFAGGGGSSLGYRLAGGRCLAVSEFVPEAARTYMANFSDCLIDPRDIREFSGSDQAVVEFLARVDLKAGELDVLDGSPPCCEFSTAGRGIGDQDVPRRYSDVFQSNIASLPFDWAELVHRALPKVCICENVPAFRTRGREVFDRFMDALRYRARDRVYYCHSEVLVASEHGVPQKRPRLFVIGIRKDVGDAIGINFDDAVQRVFPTPMQAEIGIRSALTGLCQSPEDVWPWKRAALVTQLRRLIRLLPKEPPKPTRLQHIYPDYSKHYTLTRCSFDKPAPTLVVAGQRPNGLTGAIHPSEDRKFTLPELRRLTGLPDDFVLTGTLGQAAERVCRMVPPFLTKAIAESVYQKVLLPYSEMKK
jgi:DNA-cytosine methyltransferase